ncbi:hypothetical protein [Leucobacter japonicus]|uniref:hypothetical protein n=1 Tax=Leucobacter japonicus TaxID=1461259 RepID=UPI0012E2488A|nr:hypothetical protein [Leucobacter japonicus]
MVEIAAQEGWIHDNGRLAGTINARRMAAGLGVSVSTITRAYDEGATGLLLLEKLHDISGLPLDSLVTKVAA